MKKNSKTFKKNNLDRFVFLLLIDSCIVVVVFIATDHLPAWTHTWGTIFAVANNFAISFICTTLFYILTVYRPAAIEKQQKKAKAKVEFKALKNEINLLGHFLIGHANRLTGQENSETKISQMSINEACRILSDNEKWSDDNFYKLLQIHVNNLTKHAELLLVKYEDILLSDVETALKMFFDNTGFYCVLDAQIYDRKADDLLKHNIFSDYYLPAEKLIEFIDLMLNEE